MKGFYGHGIKNKFERLRDKGKRKREAEIERSTKAYFARLKAMREAAIAAGDVIHLAPGQDATIYILPYYQTVFGIRFSPPLPPQRNGQSPVLGLDGFQGRRNAERAARAAWSGEWGPLDAGGWEFEGRYIQEIA